MENTDTTMDIAAASATEIAAAIRGGEVSAAEVVDVCSARVRDRGPVLNAVVATNPQVEQDAARADEEAASGNFRGPLHGVPFTVKDTLALAGLPATAGSPLLADHVPTASATAVDRLLAAGAIPVGKTNCSEFAVATHSSNPLFGDTWNPWDARLTSGGSSGGDSAAVAAGMAAFGLGTDFGGSIRWPAHCTGLTSMRPTAGLIPQTGMLPFVPGGGFPAPPSFSVLHRLGTIGWLARSAADHAVLLELLRGPDGVDPNTVPVAPGGQDVEISGLRCAWFAGEGTVPVRSDVVEVVRGAAEALAARGVEVSNTRPPGVDRAAEVFVELRTAAGMPDVVRLAAGRHDLVSPLLRESLLEEPSQPVSRLFGASRARDEILREVLSFMDDHDVLLLPVASVPAVDPAEAEFEIDGQRVPWNQLGSSCRAMSILGFPVVVVPCGYSAEGLPVGVQVVGRPFEDHLVIRVASELEEVFGRFTAPDPRG
ncbi:amidase [Saccharopolyspora sp. NPDC002686]|uniref:amidase n=1 Tax=Saccharopolyspora sp. NPDC002686 TaxID=3154541 RepID=UPI003316C766